MWQNETDINKVVEIRTKTSVFFGVGAISKIDEIIKNLNADKVIVVSGKGAYKITGAWAHVEKALGENNVAYVNYDKVSPNPTTHQVDEATKMGREFGAQAVIAIGGGSAIDAGKSVAILLENSEKNATDLYTFKFEPKTAKPIVAINLTHGTGTEANRFAVVTVPEMNFKPAIAYDCIYPTFSIDDPQFCTKLSPVQTLYVSVDAVNHVVEAATTKVSSPYTVTLAREVVELVAKYLPVALKEPENLEARYFLLYASMIGGMCFDNGLLHYTHALEHPLSALKPELAHGLGLAILLPAVVEEIFEEKKQTLSYILEPAIGAAKEAKECALKLENWLKELGVTHKLDQEGFSEKDVEKLTQLAFETPSLGLLLSVAPTEATQEAVKRIYTNSLKFYK